MSDDFRVPRAVDEGVGQLHEAITGEIIYPREPDDPEMRPLGDDRPDALCPEDEEELQRELTAVEEELSKLSQQNLYSDPNKSYPRTNLSYKPTTKSDSSRHLDTIQRLRATEVPCPMHQRKNGLPGA